LTEANERNASSCLRMWRWPNLPKETG